MLITDSDANAGSPPSVNPPRVAARAPKQAAETVYYSESSDEEVDEELRAMQNIRNRGPQAARYGRPQPDDVLGLGFLRSYCCWQFP